MKNIFAMFVMGIFLISFVSAGISLDKQPEEIYNLGDRIQIVVKIIPELGLEDYLTVNLFCGDSETEVYREFLVVHEEKLKEILTPLVDSLIGNSSLGECELRVRMGEEQISSDAFRISDKIIVNIDSETSSYAPGEVLSFEGVARTENGENVWGDAIISFDGLEFEEDVIEGKFEFEYYINLGTAAGEKPIMVNVSDGNEEEEALNFGSKIYIINVKQIPTSVEVVLDSSEIVPGNSIKGKIVLHDQTGEKIDAEAYVAIKNSFDEIVEKIELQTDQEFEHFIENNESSSTWVVSAYSRDLIGSAEVELLENEEVTVEILNDTLWITNVGNVPYNATLDVEIGNNIVHLPLFILVGEVEKYALEAPEGEYLVKVAGIERSMFLTGNAIDIEQITDGAFAVDFFIWVFIILILVVAAYLIYRRGKKRNYFTKTSSSSGDKTPKLVEEKMTLKEEKSKLVEPDKKLEMSLSIVGTKQNASVGCISLKNYSEIKSGHGNVKETLSEINSLIDSEKGLIYNNNENIFFILAPSMTKTFQNQKKSIEIANKIREILMVHNKKFKQKINFGLSVNYGTVVTKDEKDSVKFMSLGTLMTDAKKLANKSSGDVYVSEKAKEKIKEKVKGEVVHVGNLKAYKIADVSGKPDHSTFLKGFIARQERDRKLAEEKKKKDKK